MSSLAVHGKHFGFIWFLPKSSEYCLSLISGWLSTTNLDKIAISLWKFTNHHELNLKEDGSRSLSQTKRCYAWAASAVFLFALFQLLTLHSPSRIKNCRYSYLCFFLSEQSRFHNKALKYPADCFTAPLRGYLFSGWLRPTGASG